MKLDGGSFGAQAVKALVVVVGVLAAAGEGVGAEPQVAWPFEVGGKLKAANKIDTLVLGKLRREGIQPANLCSDAVFIRRVHLDVTGTLPDGRRVDRFMKDRSADKRRRLIDELMKRKEMTDYLTQKWCDLLRVKAEFPINLWPNAVQAYSRWIHDAVKTNMPYDRFARELLTASGSNFRVGQVNFYRGIQGRKPETIAAAVALTFMGVRFDKLPEAGRKGMAAFFSRVAYKGTAEWKEVVVHLDPTPAGELKATFPDGKSVRITFEKDPRVVFADWLISPQNPWFTRSIVNRVWSWLLGRGIIHEPDDIRPDNAAAHPRVLEYLTGELVKAKYDLRHIFRLILNSSVYQQSSIPRSKHRNAGAMFAHYQVRRLDAEVLLDVLKQIFGSGEEYSSLIPEPYTFIPREMRTVELTDGSITSQFLKMFGRPARDTGMEAERSNKSSDRQRLHMLNSTHVQNMINRSWRMRGIGRFAGRDTRKLVGMLYMTILSRPPTKDEITKVTKYLSSDGVGRSQGTVDLAWALVNSKEFLYRH